MKITSVSYRETSSFGDYQNATVEATAQVDVDELHGDVLEVLKDWVREELKGRCVEYHRVENEDFERREKSRDLEALERSIAAAREKWEKAKAFLVSHGIDPVFLEESPF